MHINFMITAYRLVFCVVLNVTEIDKPTEN